MQAFRALSPDDLMGHRWASNSSCPHDALAVGGLIPAASKVKDFGPAAAALAGPVSS